MIKVFLVEDEAIVRNGIKKRIKWEENGFEFVGEASDGELAYPMIQKAKPDIVITDIKMPFMDGLELSRLIKQEMPQVKIVILSGYDEFEYAKEAISIGITDYLLKPIDGSGILETLDNIKSMIEEERRQQEYMEQFKKEMQEERGNKKTKLFWNIIENKFSYMEAINAGKKLNIELTAEQYNLLLFQMFAKDEDVQIDRIENVRIGSLLEQNKEIISFERGVDGWAFLIAVQDKARMEQTEEFCKNMLQQYMEELPRFSYFGVTGEPVERLGELKHCFEKANRAFAYRYLNEKNQIIKYDEIDGLGTNKEKLNLNTVDVNKVSRKAVERFLRSGKANEIVDFVEDLFSSIGEVNVNSLLLRQYILIDIHFAIQSFMEQLGVSVEGGEEITECLVSLERTKQYIRQMLTKAIDARDMVSKKKYSAVIHEAKKYILENFNNEEISLNTVAANVNISPSHFSTIFSQETGQNFVEFLTEVRMEKAKELLLCSSMKCAEIGYEVGYKDSHYFTYLFKKTQGITPTNYRARGNHE